MGKEVYVLEGERGEYSDRTQDMYGVFATLAEARAALDAIPEVAAAGWATYCAYEREVEAMAAAAGAPKVETYILNQTDEERAAWNRHVDTVIEIKKSVGGGPPWICESDRYWITKFTVGELGDGEIVFDSDEVQHAV